VATSPGGLGDIQGHCSIPFFFEPNFDAIVEPLPAALQLREDKKRVETEGAVPGKQYQRIVYGDFLCGKVGSNFVVGKGKYA
jgi:isopenicillin N synthase-like dioxygenase